MQKYKMELASLPATREPRLTVWLEGFGPDIETAKQGGIMAAGQRTQHWLGKRARKAGSVISFEVLQIREIGGSE